MFTNQYRVKSIHKTGKEHWNHSGKIIFPVSASEELFSQEITFPIQFEISSQTKTTHCGVWEFTAKEGFCYLPDWLMEQLNIKENDIISVKNVSLTKANFIKFNAQTESFLLLDDPKTILEQHLPEFTCLTVGDIIPIPYSGFVYMLQVMELKPNHAVLINETDCELEFYEPPKTNQVPINKNLKKSFPVQNKFTPFSGKGYKLN
jgi:ubiquitin fusion degradation protein 1